MNTVLVQEVIRYNKLLSTVRQTLNDLLTALKGLVVMSQALETMSNSLFNNSVPEMWASKVRLPTLLTISLTLYCALDSSAIYSREVLFRGY